MSKSPIVAALCVLLLSSAASAGPKEDLFTACMQCDLAKAEQAITDGADPKGLHPSGQNMLSLAFFCPDVTRMLLDKGVSPDEGNYPALISASNNYMTETMQLLLDAGADPMKASSAGVLPIFQVVQQTNCVPCLKMLLEKGVDANAKNAQGATLLHVLMNFGMDQAGRKTAFAAGAKTMRDTYKLNVPEWLFELPDERNGTRLEMLQALLDKGADVNTPDPMGFTPLIQALRGAKVDLALAIAKAGADPKVRPKVKMGIGKVVYDPLVAAAENGNLEIVKLLVEKGADLDYGSQSATVTAFDGVTGGEGYTPLILALRSGKLDVARYLLEQGADLEKGTKGFTVLKNARENMECLASVKNKLPIYFAIEAGDLDLVTAIADRMDAGLFKPEYTIQQWGGSGGQGSNKYKVCTFSRRKIKPSQWAEMMNWPEAKTLLEEKGL